MVSLRHRILHTIYKRIVKPWISLKPTAGSPPARLRIIQEGDRVVLRHKGQTITLTSPLHVKGKTGTRVGEIAHDAIIGKEPRDIVVSSKDNRLRVHLPSLEEHVLLTPRLVTPIYPSDANLIVNLLDLHPHEGWCPPTDEPETEILEAGTGHGALTLHLARAVHAANAGRDTSIVDFGNPRIKHANPGCRALIHTVDVSRKYSEHAIKIVSDFRQGMYLRDVQFHVGSVSEWVDQQMNARGKGTFLSHAVLDLPSSHSHIEKATSALHVDGKLVLFNPSITQINQAMELVKTRRLPLQLERVVEVGPAMTGGRIWDVRFVKPRALDKELRPRETALTDEGVHQGAGSEEAVTSSGAVEEGILNADEGYQMVCRPKVGDRISGGGFVALWSKNKIRKDE